MRNRIDPLGSFLNFFLIVFSCTMINSFCCHVAPAVSPVFDLFLFRFVFFGGTRIIYFLPLLFVGFFGLDVLLSLNII